MSLTFFHEVPKPIEKFFFLSNRVHKKLDNITNVRLIYSATLACRGAYNYFRNDFGPELDPDPKIFPDPDPIKQIISDPALQHCVIFYGCRIAIKFTMNGWLMIDRKRTFLVHWNYDRPAQASKNIVCFSHSKIFITSNVQKDKPRFRMNRRVDYTLRIQGGKTMWKIHDEKNWLLEVQKVPVGTGTGRRSWYLSRYFCRFYVCININK